MIEIIPAVLSKNYKNMKKISRKWLGFIQIIVAIIIWLSSGFVSSFLEKIIKNIFNIKLDFFLFINPFIIIFFVLSLILLIKGLSNLFSKNKINIIENKENDKKISNSLEPKILVVIGVVFLTFLLWVPLVTGKHWDILFFLTIIGVIPSTVIGLFCLIRGIILFRKIKKQRVENNIQNI